MDLIENEIIIFEKLISELSDEKTVDVQHRKVLNMLSDFRKNNDGYDIKVMSDLSRRLRSSFRDYVMEKMEKMERIMKERYDTPA